MTDQRDPQNSTPSPKWTDIIISVFSAFFGVQSERNRERDFKHGKAIHYIIVGVVVTLLIIVSLVILVQSVLRASGV